MGRIVVLAGELDLVFIAGLINKLDGEFVVAPNIRSPSGLESTIDERVVGKLEEKGLF